MKESTIDNARAFPIRVMNVENRLVEMRKSMVLLDADVSDITVAKE